YERLDDPVTHTRSVLFVKPDPRNNLPEYLIVRDQFTAKKRHRYSILYHLAPGCDATASSARGDGGNHIEARQVSRTNGGSNDATLPIRVICETDLKTRGFASVTAYVSEGWVSSCYAQYASAPVAVFEAEGTGPQEFFTLIFPGALDQIV